VPQFGQGGPADAAAEAGPGAGAPVTDAAAGRSIRIPQVSQKSVLADS
jgi:hypothetical protein